MLARSLLSQILTNEAITRGLGDAEARIMVEWLVDQAEMIAKLPSSEDVARDLIEQLCRRCRSIGRFVSLWCQKRGRGAATQLAATERFPWPLPASDVDPCELMQTILDWEGDAMRGELVCVD